MLILFIVLLLISRLWSRRQAHLHCLSGHWRDGYFCHIWTGSQPEISADLFLCAAALSSLPVLIKVFARPKTQTQGARLEDKNSCSINITSQRISHLIFKFLRAVETNVCKSSYDGKKTHLNPLKCFTIHYFFPHQSTLSISRGQPKSKLCKLMKRNWIIMSQWLSV